MSLLQHLRLYHGNWMEKRDELNELFSNRPELPFTIYPSGEVITGRPIIADTLICDTFTTIPGTNEVMQMIDYYKDFIHYRIRCPNNYAISFDCRPHIYYPSELIFIHEIETYTFFLPNRFTIVV